MPLYKYKARGHRGDTIEGTMEAENSDAVASQLMEGKLTPIAISLAKQSAMGTLNIDFRKLFPVKVSDTDLVQFSRQMHSLIKAGIPILSALHGLSQSTKNRALADTVLSIAHSLESGRNLASALSEHPKIFNLFYISMIRIGETTGQLDEVFSQLARYLEEDKRIRDQIKSALRYPSFVITAIIIAIALINIFVIPAFSGVFAKFGADLPLATKILTMISSFTVANWHALLGGTIAAAVATRSFINTENGRYIWDKYKLNLPIVGDIIYRATLARFSRLFAMATRAGVPLITTLSIVSRALENAYVEDRIVSMQGGIERGESITRTATTAGIFNALVLQMIAVGEETGAIDHLMDEVAAFYEAEVQYDIDRLSSTIEPLLTVVIGFIVLVLAWGVFLPMWSLAEIAIK